MKKLRTYQGCIDEKDVQLLRKIGIRCNIYWSVDEIIDTIRKKWNVVIYNRADPHVSPITHKIVYNFAVKYCNLTMGWNGRVYINSSYKWDSNIYEAKRRAIRAAAQWILAHRCKKISIKSRKHEKSKRKA